MVNGLAMGGGFELAMCCDFRIASDTARLGLVEVRIGSTPGAGGMQRLPRLIGIAKAKEMLYLAETIDAAEALRIGLVNKVVSVASLMDEAKKMANALIEMPPHALKIAKRCINEGTQIPLESALKLDVTIRAEEMSTPLAKANFEEGRKAFAEKRKPVWKLS